MNTCFPKFDVSCLYFLDIDECKGVTCQNNGTCKDGDNSYTCECATGYEGVHCETS